MQSKETLKAVFLEQLPKRVSAIADNWQNIRKSGWSSSLIDDLYRRVTELGGAAGKYGLSQLSDAALSIEVYLSSFVDTALTPSHEQMKELSALIHALCGLSGTLRPTDPTRTAHSSQATKADECAIYTLLPGLTPIDEFEDVLRQKEFNITAFESRQALSDALEKVAPAAIILSNDALNLFEDKKDFRNQINASKTRHIGLIVFSDNTSLETRLSAMHAGADAYYTLPLDSESVASDISRLIVPREAREYRVLIVDDDPAQSAFAAAVLQKSGMKTMEVTEPLRVPDMLSSFKPDLVLMDLYMPDANGIELTTYIRENNTYATLPVVFLSGEHDENIRLDALTVGGDDFLCKPVSPKLLITTIQNRINRSRKIHAASHSKSVRDPLTGVFTKRHLLARLDKAVRSTLPDKTPPAVLYIEIDHPRKLREKIGIGGVDTLVSAIARALDAELDGSTPLARCRDTGFALYTTNGDEGHSTALAQRILKAVETRVFDIDGRSVTTTLSIGICRADVLAEPVQTLTCAERCCFEAMENGGNRYQVFVAEDIDRDKPLDDAQIAVAIKQAIEQSSVQTLFQSAFSLQSDTGKFYWMHFSVQATTTGHLNEQQARDIAARYGLTDELDRWLFRNALERLSAFSDETMTINLIIDQNILAIHDVERASWMRNMLESYPLNSNQLILAFDTDDVASAIPSSDTFFKTVRELGMDTALSGFDAKKEHLQLLNHIQPGYIRLLPACNELSPAVFTTLAQQAHKRQIRLIAHQTEDPKAIATLWRSGADLILDNFIQGTDYDIDDE